jgi:DNA-binding FrmR family transcriptional regulator
MFFSKVGPFLDTERYSTPAVSIDQYLQRHQPPEREPMNAASAANLAASRWQRIPHPGTTSGRYPEHVIADIKKRALHRARILEGQLRGVEKMIENEDYCMDIITQSLAIQKSLGSLNKLLVENHLRTHVTDMFDAGGGERDDAIAELLKVFELSNNRG